MTQYPKNWTPESVEKFVTQESRQKTREEFEATHVPITRIKVTNNQISDWEDGSSIYVNEDQFRDAVIDSSLSDDNRLFFVAGEAGSGKSELCQWLDYQIQDRNEGTVEEFQHQPIHIPREVREPREVFQRLADYIDEETLEEASTLAELPPESVYESTIGNIGVQFTKDKVSTVDLIQDEAFRDEVRENLNRFVASYDDPSQELEFEPISEEKLADLIDKYPGVQDEHSDRTAPVKEVLYNTITRSAKNAIKDMLFLGDLKSTLGQINKRFQEQNQRPVLIIEDLTGFTIFQHEILSFFSDLSASNWDVVIGLTTGMEQKLVEGKRADITSEDTINDRIKARVTLTEQTDDGAKTLFLEQEDVHINLARNYLRAIKADSDTEFDPTLPIPEEELNKVFGEELYPFNERFLTHVYENLEENNQKKQTPRIYLKFVIEGLLTNQNPPFEHAELLGRLGTIDHSLSSDYDDPDRNLLKWYGHKEDDQYVVDVRIPQVFDVESDGWAPVVDGAVLCDSCGRRMVEADGGVLVCESCETICDECEARMERQGEYWVCTVNSDHKKPIEGPGHLFKARRQNLIDWRAEGADFHQTAEIEDGAEEVLQFFYSDPTSLVRDECRSSNAGAIWWSKGSRTIPIHIDNGDEPDYRKVVLSSDLPESVLIDLLRVGVYDQSVEEHIERGTIDIQELRDWADETVSEFQESLEQDIRDQFGVSIDEVSLFGKYLLNLFSGKGAEFSAEALSQPVRKRDINLSARPEGLEASLKKLETNADMIMGLFHARYHLRTNMVDHQRLRRHAGEVGPAQLADWIGKVQNGNMGFKIGPTKSEAVDLKEFLITTSHFNLRGFSRNIGDYNGKHHSDRTEVLETLESLSAFYSGLGEIDDLDFKTIEDGFDQAGKPKPSVVNDVRNIEVDTFESIVSSLHEAVSALEDGDDVWTFIDAYHNAVRLKYGTYKDEFKHLRRFAKELETLERTLESQLDEIDEIEIDVDTGPFDAAQKEANTLAELLKIDS